jgi:hypothetical protein
MCQVKVLRPVDRLVSIPVDIALYCRACRNVTNSPSERCCKCGSDFVLRLITLVDRPPRGPGSGPASSGCIVPSFHLEVAKAA